MDQDSNEVMHPMMRGSRLNMYRFTYQLLPSTKDSCFSHDEGGGNEAHLGLNSSPERKVPEHFTTKKTNRSDDSNLELFVLDDLENNLDLP